MIKIVNLKDTLNPINAQERRKINENWDELRRSISSLRNQINILSGETSVEDILNMLNGAINNANTQIQDLTNNGNMVIGELNSSLNNLDNRLIDLQTAIDNANAATEGTNSAIADARQTISDLNDYFSNFSFLGEYSSTTTYQQFNFVRNGKSTFVALKTNLGILPVDDGVNWRLVAAGGVDGNGSVSSVNNQMPDTNGNVSVGIEDIPELSSQLQGYRNELDEILVDYSRTIYVSMSGDDSNQGESLSNSVRTIQRAVELWQADRNKAANTLIKISSGTYAGAVIDSVVVPRQLVIEGELTSGVPSTVIDSSLSTLINGLNFNGGVRARVRYIKVQNFSNSGIIFQNGSYGVIDTCDAAGNMFAGFNANQYSNLDIIGNCNITLPSGGKGIRYYRQCTGSWSDPSTIINVDGQGNICDGIEIRDNSYVVAGDGVNVTNCNNTGILLRRHSYLELRTANINNNAVGITLRDLSLFANASGVLTMDGNTENYSYQGFSLPFINTNSFKNTAVGSNGPSVQVPTTTGYDLIINSKNRTGIQFLTDENAAINIDFNKSGRIAYNIADNSIRFFQNNAESLRMRTDALLPLVDNTLSLGASAFRYKDIYAGSATINTSDRNSKQQISEIDDKILDAWSQVNFAKFKFNDAVKEKGDKARWHFGLIAQDIYDTFKKYGLDAFEYGLLCYDEWDDIYESDEDGNEKLILKAGSIWGIRSDECQFLEMALMRREIEKLKK